MTNLNSNSNDTMVPSILPDSVVVGGVVTTSDIKKLKQDRLKLKAEKTKYHIYMYIYKLDMERSTNLQVELLERNRRMGMENGNKSYTGSKYN